MKGIIEYSEKIPGAKGNYGWPVRYDLTDGYLGISQYTGEAPMDHVLLSPRQVLALVEFVQRKAGLLRRPKP